MENRPLSVVAGLIVLLAMPLAALAEELGADAAQQAAWEERLATAAAMQAESKAAQGAGDKLLEQRNLDCATKFFVTACRTEAYQEYLTTTRAARRLEVDGKTQEREVKKEQLADRARRLAEAAPQRDAELQARQAETAATQRMAEEKAAATRAEKAKKGAAGERRKAVEAESLRRKQAAHDARVAAKKQQAEQRAAREAARK